jgi:hypothetical protein
MKSFSRYQLLFFFLTFSIASQGQEKSEDILISAMQDELKRNVDQLRLPGYGNPFFMMYGIRDEKSHSVSATLGSLAQSSSTPIRFRTTTRVLVGDYGFNDESLDDNLTSAPSELDINIPLDDDYYGIRRSFWSATDKVYRNAARHYQTHQQSLKETGKELKDIPHRSFAKGTSVKMISPLNSYAWGKSKWEDVARNLSALFLKHNDILTSAVAINYLEGFDYLVNSEGTIAKIPFNAASLMVIAQSKNEKGEVGFDRILIQKKTPNQFPSESELTTQIEKFISHFEKQFEIPKFEEEYSGPVLLMGSSVADVLYSSLVRSRESLMCNDNIAKLKGFQFDPGSAMDGKIGKAIIHESMTVKAKPKLEIFNGIDLLGTFAIDPEGVVPADETVLIEKGILKTLMNNRNITHPSQTSNGFSGGPGVLEITTTFRNTEKELKDKLIAKAKAEGLDFGIILRDAGIAGIGIVDVYKVSVADGKEELMRQGFLQQPGMKALKRLMGATEKYTAHNMSGNAQGNPAANGVEVSLIIPEGILLEELEIKPFPIPTFIEEKYTSNPLKGITVLRK